MYTVEMFSTASGSSERRGATSTKHRWAAFAFASSYDDGETYFAQVWLNGRVPIMDTRLAVRPHRPPKA